MTGGFKGLDAEQIEKDVAGAFKVMFKMGKAFTLREAGPWWFMQCLPRYHLIHRTLE